MKQIIWKYVRFKSPYLSYKVGDVVKVKEFVFLSLDAKDLIDEIEESVYKSNMAINTSDMQKALVQSKKSAQKAAAKRAEEIKKATAKINGEKDCGCKDGEDCEGCKDTKPEDAKPSDSKGSK